MWGGGRPPSPYGLSANAPTIRVKAFRTSQWLINYKDFFSIIFAICSMAATLFKENFAKLCITKTRNENH